jgi:hypothetical protein
MAQNPKGGEPIPATPPRPASAPPSPQIVDENARRLREWGPKVQVFKVRQPSAPARP